MTPTLLHFGAGAIGRGLVGWAFSELGHQLVFVDADEALVDRLNEAGEYTVRTSDGERTLVRGVRALSALDAALVTEAVRTADVISTAVGPHVLPAIAEGIGDGLRSRSGSVNVLACENSIPNSGVVRASLKERFGEEAVREIGFPEVMVDRVVPGGASASLDVLVEPHFEFAVDVSDWRGPVPAGGPITFTEHLPAYRLRKLWILNGLHALTAYLGIEHGVEYIHEAIEVPAVRRAVEGAGRAIVRVLGSEGMDEKELELYLEKTIGRFGAAGLRDPVDRVGRNPLAKLSGDERILAPARRAAELGLPLDGFAEGIAAALAARAVPGGDALEEALAGGWRRLLEGHGGLGADHPLVEEVARILNRPKRGGHMSHEKAVTLEHAAGMHARPASLIVEAARACGAEVFLAAGERKVSAASVFGILTLGAKKGDVVVVSADGDVGREAVETIVDIIEADGRDGL